MTEAVDAYEIVSDCALGAAVGEIRGQESARAGRPVLAEYHRLLAHAAAGRAAEPADAGRDASAKQPPTSPSGC